MMRTITWRERFEKWENNPESALAFLQSLFLKSGIDIDTDVRYLAANKTILIEEGKPPIIKKRV